ncbi:MAG: chemotaxis protein CheW [Deltaproteobacteria bacterium]|nr:chemotaxis protein CheW [Deltaproteobacteria bacterium]
MAGRDEKGSGGKRPAKKAAKKVAKKPAKKVARKAAKKTTRRAPPEDAGAPPAVAPRAAEVPPEPVPSPAEDLALLEEAFAARSIEESLPAPASSRSLRPSRGAPEPELEAEEEEEEEEEEEVDPLDRFFFRPDQGPQKGLELALAALAAAPDAGWREALEADKIEAFLTFRMNDEWYAVPIAALQEIVRPLPVTPVPRTPEHVLGVVTLRGVVLPVLDLHLRLGLEHPTTDRRSRLLVLDSQEGPAAFLVEEVGGVWRPQDPRREPPPSSLGARGELIETLLRADERVLPLLDLRVSLAVELEERGHRGEARGG